MEIIIKRILSYIDTYEGYDFNQAVKDKLNTSLKRYINTINHSYTSVSDMVADKYNGKLVIKEISKWK